MNCKLQLWKEILVTYSDITHSPGIWLQEPRKDTHKPHEEQPRF